MPFYHRLGDIPRKRHTQFRHTDGRLLSEELMGTRGFSGVQSTLYHLHSPTALISSELYSEETLELADPPSLQPSHVQGADFESVGDPITARRWLFVNNDIKIGLSTPTDPMHYFYRNALCDELLFFHEGSGVLYSQFGVLPFCRGDYIIIPVGTTYTLEHHGPARVLVAESRGRIVAPKRYRNEHGQLLENSPYCERDIRTPESLETHDEAGLFEIHVRQGNRISRLVLDHHPFDVVGWDGYLFPWALNISDFEPITGRVHQPPPVHQTFAADGFVVCSFVPRMYDYHPQAVPVPYNHSNVNSDEVLYYVEGEFMSRKGVQQGSFTLHPAGIPHGPHPGTVEASIGKERTEELAVMIDTFHPLHLTQEAAGLVDVRYLQSWLEQ